MPKNKKSDTSDSDSGPEDRQPAKKSKTSEKKPQKNKEEEHSWLLEKMKFVKVREFKGKVMVDIREFYEKDGDLLPGRKGISLSAAQWKKLVGVVDEVNAAIDEY
ncbi:unnamed protein product [Bemisia tabaci]|uniref:Transcriptional coactivator p15 (PC4) C-terminal domain-containing protein n=1 Tax=Bemisia tabaci TaxID=7038 RepID=A0A9P0A4I0_BEMTA|nr:PREDICTED: RNA polymerase II transcriptional coactivator [Bemisia tabaci]CAH0384352.1 unnamed protein product [Bemisia tabaci]